MCSRVPAEDREGVRGRGDSGAPDSGHTGACQELRTQRARLGMVGKLGQAWGSDQRPKEGRSLQPSTSVGTAGVGSGPRGGTSGLL